YQIQSTFLSKCHCNAITNIYTSIVKQKARLARSTPNSTLHHPNIYALNTLYNIQQQQHIHTLDRSINSPDFDKRSLKICLQQNQNSANSNKSILIEQLVLTINKARTNT